PTPVPTPTPEEEVPELESITSGLDKLDSYRINWNMSFEGKDEEGNPVQWTLQWQEEYTKEPPARRITMQGSGLGMEETGSIQLIQIEDKTYMIIPGQGCLTTEAAEEDVFKELITPDEFGGISGGQFVGVETINGVKAKHYSFDEKALGMGLEFVRAKGDIWVAPEGYVIKYVLEAEGKEEVFGKGAEGKLRWDYEVVDINEPFTIEVPEECAQLVPEDIPILPDAAELSSFMGMTSYSTEKPFVEVVKFYKDEMAAKGWKQAEGSMETENMAMFNYTKDNRSVTIMISPQEGKVQVTIQVQTQ
ncbi:MAG: hypothetical protein DRI61_07790, partial [Chloroflexi bacterium]